MKINQWFFYGDTGLYARELRRAGLALVETKLCSSRCSGCSVQGHDQRPLRLGILSSFVMKPIGEPGAQELGALYCLTSFVLFVGVDGHVRDYIAWISSMDFSITFGDVDAYSKVTHAGSTPLGPMAGRLPRSPIRRRPQQRRRPQPRRPHLPRAATTRGRVERQRIHLRRRL